MASEPVPPVIGYLDVVLVVLAAPIMLLIGVPALGYGVGGGTWLALRAAGVGIERAVAGRQLRSQVSLRMGYMLARLFLLALAVIVARGGGQNDGLTALVVIVAAFTVQLALSALNRPGSPR